MATEEKSRLFEEIGRLNQELSAAKSELEKLSASGAPIDSPDQPWLAKLLDHVSDGAFAIVANKVTYANPAFAATLGISRDQLVGVAFDKVISREDLAKVRGAIRVGGDEDHGSDQLVHLLHRDGETRVPALVKLWNTRAADARMIVGIARDPAELRRGSFGPETMRAKLRQSQKLKAVGSLAGGVAHDMNNILGSIMSLASTMLAETQDPQKRADMEDILAATRRGRDLTRNLLGFARKGKLRKEHLSFNDIIDGVQELLARTVSKKIDWRVHLDEKLRPIEGDFGQLSHAVMNICINAADALGSDGGLIAIQTENVELALGDPLSWPGMKPGGHVLVRIADNGAGMTEEVATQVFEPFFTTKGAEKGTGLGLSMVYGTIKNHGGQISIDSAPGHGTTVTFVLPHSSRRRPDLRRSGAYAAVARKGDGRLVLVVDDEDLVRRAAKRAIASMGYQVVDAASGEEALRIFEQRKGEVALVVLDLVMPGMDGAETFYQLRNIDDRVPIVIASGFTKEGGAEELLRSGAAGFVQKPFDIQTLSDALYFAERVAPR